MIPKKWYGYFTGNHAYQNFIVFAPVLSFLMLDSNRKVTNWISTNLYKFVKCCIDKNNNVYDAKYTTLYTNVVYN